MKGFKLFESQERIYYWVASKPEPIQIGFYLPPGPTTFQDDKNFPRNTIEQVFEAVRKKYKPNAPSRLGGIFLCPNLDTCNYYLRAFRKNGGLYKVQLESSEKPFLTDGDVWGDCFYRIMRDSVFGPEKITFERAYELGKDCALQYWQGGRSEVEKAEYILPGTAKVKVLGPATKSDNEHPAWLPNPDYDGPRED